MTDATRKDKNERGRALFAGSLPAVFMARWGDHNGPTVRLYPSKEQPGIFVWIIWDGVADLDDVCATIRDGGVFPKVGRTVAAEAATSKLLRYVLAGDLAPNPFRAPKPR